MESNQEEKLEKTPEPETKEGLEKKNTGMAILAYLLFFIPLLTETKDDPFVKYHVKQGLLIFLGWMITFFFQLLPLIGRLIGGILAICVLILMIFGILNASQGKKKPLPLIGQLAEQFNL